MNYLKLFKSSFAFVTILAVISCTHKAEDILIPSNKLFTTIPPKFSGIDFQNKLVETESSNYYKYMYSYIGGGVAAADFNNDNLEDLFFISNSFDNKLYLNLGDLKFNDITEAAGIKKRKGFDVGVTVVDINNDGWQDIYITRGGWIAEDNAFANMLYINQGLKEDGRTVSFIESAQEYGLDDNNRAIQATFFDYDRDGDLDVYISNTPDFEDRDSKILDLVKARSDPKTLALKGSDKLYNNDGKGRFEDVSEASGIFPDIGFGLNPQVGDLNNDGWLDIYVCNDFKIPDFVYINNANGTFREGRNELFKHMSFNSMGSDIGDINNDGLADLYTLDMNPADYIRSKTTMGMTQQSRFDEMVRMDYHYQYMHNMMHVNNGNGSFREVANLSGIANTDWSWSALLADFDLDGYNDIFVTNGVFRDVIDRDANNKILQNLRDNPRKPTDKDFLDFTRMLPQQKLTNYIFKNNGDLTFENVSFTWADSVPNFSNGASYSDLDNDGDLDIIINNINDPAIILKNNTIEKKIGNYLKVQLQGPENNIAGVGTTVKIKLSDDQILTRTVINSRGFLSAVSKTLHFGLKENKSVQLEILWANGKHQLINEISINQLVQVRYSDAKGADKIDQREVEPKLFNQLPFAVSHIDPPYDDFQKQILLPHKLSQTGPASAAADVNNDGLIDVFIGGGHTQPGQLLIAKKSGGFKAQSVIAFEKDRQHEDVAASFFDADNDGDQDLYVSSGSYEFIPNSKLLLDRLYINNGAGNFVQSPSALPEILASGSVVISEDFDMDGDIDLFVGSRVIPGAYPFPPNSYLLENNEGQFDVVSKSLVPELTQIGMVTDAQWTDMDNDGDPDLVLTGEWLGIEVFENKNGQIIRSEAYRSLSSSKGWWNKLHVADIDGDGDQDIIAGNLGLNSKFHASTEKPFHIYTKDFDFNGTVDVILAKYYKDMEVPVRGKTCTAQQLPHLAHKIPTYNEFANLDVQGILGPGVESALHYEVSEFRSGIFYREGDDFVFKPFENEVQCALINSILYEDFDGDGVHDLLMAGNNYLPEIETTRQDAGVGFFLSGMEQGKFNLIPNLESGFFVNKDVRNMLKADQSIIVINNQDIHDLFEINQTKVL